MDHNQDDMDGIQSIGISRSRSTSSADESSSSKKTAVKHLYSVKEKEKDVQHEREDFQANLKNLQQQVEGQNDIDQDLVKQLHALQQAYDSHVTKWNETENFVVTLRNQKNDLEVQVRSLNTSLLEANNEIKNSHKRIEELERQLQHGQQPSTHQAPQIVYVPQPTSTAEIAPTPDFSKLFQEINNALGSITSQLESQFSNFHRVLEENHAAVSQSSFQNETRSTLSQIQEAQFSLQTALTNLCTIASTVPSSVSPLAPKPVEAQAESQPEEPLPLVSTPAPVVVSHVADSQLLETMKNELESFKQEFFALLQQQQASAQTLVASSSTESLAPSKEPVAEEPSKEPTEDTSTSAPPVKKAPAPVKTTATTKASTTTAKPAVKTATATATKSSAVASKPSKTSSVASKASATTKKV